MAVHAPKEMHLLEDKSDEQPQETEHEEENNEETVSENESAEDKLACKSISDAEVCVLFFLCFMSNTCMFY